MELWTIFMQINKVEKNSWYLKFAFGENIWYNNRSLLKTKESDLYFKKKNNISCKKIV